MIKFFRKIRRNLLMENKTGKYFKYAIGEILLVVIGILIAVTINNWNNKQRIHSEEIVTLQKLIEDLKSDNERFSNNIEFYTKYHIELKNAKEIIFKKSISDEEIKEVMFFNGAIHKDLNPRTSTYNEMLNSGRIYNLSNQKLVDHIISYYQFLDESIYQNKQGRSEFRILIYGPDFTDFWFWKSEKEPFPYAKDFFNNNDSPAYRKLKQSSGWSLSINNRLMNNNKELLKINKMLVDFINQELKGK